MTTLNPEDYLETDAWKRVVKPELHQDFQEKIEAAQRVGYLPGKVIVVSGVPIVYEVIDPER